MNKHIVQIQEYSSKVLDTMHTTTENALFDVSEKLSNHYKSRLLKCSKDRNGNVIVSASNFVGVIDVDETLTIEIIPKIYPNNTTASMQNLFYMLSYSRQFNVPYKIFSSLEKFNGSFFEILIGMFAEELLYRIKGTAHQEYAAYERNRTFLRGKLLITDHIKTNGIVGKKFYTQTDEFTVNNSLNQSLKYVARGLYRHTSEPLNKKRLRACLELLDEVQDVHVSRTQINRIRLNRLNKKFENLLMLARLFINNQTLVAKSGRHDTWTILIDMNMLFENFVTQALRHGLNGSSYDVLSQGPREKFVYNVEDNREVFVTKPDISIVLNSSVLKIADTKYKLLAENDDAKYGVSQSDLYQMFSYAKKYKVNDITLIYPKTNGVMPHTLELPDNTRVHIRSISLERDIYNEIEAIEQEVLSLVL